MTAFLERRDPAWVADLARDDQAGQDPAGQDAAGQHPSGQGAAPGGGEAR